MKTISQQETEAILEMGEKISALEIEVERLKAIIAELEELLRSK
jgi:uncharacterized small protein (DUF1192 family)